MADRLGLIMKTLAVVADSGCVNDCAVAVAQIETPLEALEHTPQLFVAHSVTLSFATFVL